MKKYIKIMLAIAFVSYTSASFADITHEDCNTGIYSSYYATLNTCNTCGFHNTRFYKAQTYGLWDYFVNNQRKNYLVSTNSANSYARIHNFQATMNYTLGNYVGSNTQGLTANYLPDTVGVNGNRDGVIFLVNNVSWNQNITNRNIPIGMVEYNLRRYEISSTGTSSANTNYSYLHGTEVRAPNGLYNLQTNWVNSTGIKNYNPTPANHKECYVMLPAWCGDGVLDTWGGETCDNGAANGTPGNSCSATCQTCQNGGVGGVQRSTITASTSGLCQSGTTVGNFVSSTSGLTTSYSWSCDGVSGGNCSASYTSSNPGGGGGGGSSSTCYSLVATNTTGNTYNLTCNGNSSQYTIDIRNTTGGANTLVTSFKNTSGTYTFPSTGTYTAQCYVGSTNATDITNCRKTFGVTGVPAGNYCGDNQIGDYDVTGEECDFGTGIWPSWCSKTTCTIIEDTRPGAYNLRFAPEGDILLGDGMSIFGNLSTSYATFENNTQSDIYIPGNICVYKKNKTYNVITGNSVCSSNQVGFVGKLGGVKKIGINNNQFIADTSQIPAGVDYGESEIITTLEGLQDRDTFLKSVLNVRVAKSSVNTLGGGASLLNGTNYSDVNNLSNGGFSLLKPEYNKNLILTSLGVNPLSSYVKSTSDSSLLVASKLQGDKEISGFDKIDNNGLLNNISRLPTEKFNSFDNVFIHKGNVTLSTQNISGGNKTYVIEGGNLVLNGNITSTDNILFVVKNGNIIVKNDVTKVDAIMINIGGKILGETTPTLNRLVVNGALYGNVSDLLSKRTYIKDRGEYVDVGTNINFTSKIFDSPPPLLSKFLGEYTDISKVPK